MIIFQKVRYRNFLSTGNNFTEIQLNAKDMTLIVGRNGSGKSTFMDAICFALFNKPFRDVNKPNLVNTINQKDCLVEVYFRIGDIDYKVVRGIKPAIFEIWRNNKLINQDAKGKDYQDYLEKIILKMNWKSFTQMVILGMSFVPFMKLTASDRRSIIDDILDIQIITSMSKVLKSRTADLERAMKDVKTDITTTDIQIQASRKYIEDMRRNNQDIIDHKNKEIEENGKELDKALAEAVVIKDRIKELQNTISDADSIDGKIHKYSIIESKLDEKLETFVKEQLFYNTHNNCPTCEQSIDSSFKEKKMLGIGLKKNELEDGIRKLKEEQQKLNDRMSEIGVVLNQISKLQSEWTVVTTSAGALTNYIHKLHGEVYTLQDDKGNIVEEEQNLKEHISAKKALTEDQESYIIEKQYHDIAAGLLKDSGIKTSIINKYLPIINKQVNKYLSAMDFCVNFNLDENFNETIKSRYRDDFSYGNFSEGEKQKIDLALLFTWRTVAKLKNSINCNLLILDEVFDSSLDANATDDLLKILNTLGKDTNLFVISHKSDAFVERFPSMIGFVKENNFSKMKESL